MRNLAGGVARGRATSQGWLGNVCRIARRAWGFISGCVAMDRPPVEYFAIHVGTGSIWGGANKSV